MFSALATDKDDMTQIEKPDECCVGHSRIEAVRDGNLRSCSSRRDGRGETRKNRRGSRVESPHRIRVDSWNVGSLTGKLLELVDVLERHQVDI
ncbi:hypothetical protein Tco_0027613, partial [Tanacetum coccineum]